MNVLVDTSVWSLALRRKPGDLGSKEAASVRELTELIQEGRAQLIGIVRQEILSGIKTADQYERLRKTLRAFPDEPIDTNDFEAAGKASSELRTHGVISSVVDVLICAISVQRKWEIFTTDPDFQNYAKVLPLRLHLPRR